MLRFKQFLFLVGCDEPILDKLVDISILYSPIRQNLQVRAGLRMGKYFAKEEEILSSKVGLSPL